MQLQDILEILVKGIIQSEDSVEIKETKSVIHGKDNSHFTVKVKKEEIPLLIGKRGATIIALRVVMSKLGGKQKKMVFVDVEE